MHYVGREFTWWNNRDENSICQKRNSWSTYFLGSYISYEASGISDHSKCWVRFDDVPQSHCPPFKLYNHLTKRPQILEIVSQFWMSGSPLFHSCSFLHRFHRNLKKLVRIHGILILHSLDICHSVTEQLLKIYVRNKRWLSSSQVELHFKKFLKLLQSGSIFEL